MSKQWGEKARAAGRHAAPEPEPQKKGKAKGRGFPAKQERSALSKLLKGPGKHVK